MEDLCSTPLRTLVPPHYDRGELAEIIVHWAQREQGKAGKRGQKFYPGGCILQLVGDLAKRGELDCVLEVIGALAVAARSGAPQCADIGRTLGYSLGCGQGKEMNTVFGLAKTESREWEIIDACLALNGKTTLAEMVARSSTDFSLWIPFNENTPPDQSCGALMARDIMDQYPEMAIEVEIEEMFSKISASKLGQNPAAAEDERTRKITRLAVDGLCAWLDSPARRRYRAHLESGPKGLAIYVTLGLFELHSAQLLSEGDISKLMTGKRANRLDKTLARGARLDTSKKLNMGSIDAFRAYLRMCELRRRAGPSPVDSSVRKPRF